MSIIWIVEKAKTGGSPLAAALMGDYAVRAFASMESLAKLMRLSRNQQPDLVLVHLEGIGVDAPGVRAFADCHFHERPLLMIRAGAVKSAVAPELTHDFFELPLPLDSLNLSRAVDKVLRAQTGRHRRAVVKFRDLVLDFSKLQCLIAPDDAPVSLPLKEAQILKLFLERPRVCLSRDEIRTSIWENVKVTPRTIDSHVSRLRQRLQAAEAQIESVYGGGYVLR